MCSRVRPPSMLLLAPLAACLAAGPLATPRALAGDGAPPPRSLPRSGTQLDIVNVSVTVSDTRGRTVADLRPEDFHVVEDGVSQDVVLFTEQRVPLSVALPRC